MKRGDLELNPLEYHGCKTRSSEISNLNVKAKRFLTKTSLDMKIKQLKLKENKQKVSTTPNSIDKSQPKASENRGTKSKEEEAREKESTKKKRITKVETLNKRIKNNEYKSRENKDKVKIFKYISTQNPKEKSTKNFLKSHYCKVCRAYLIFKNDLSVHVKSHHKP